MRGFREGHRRRSHVAKLREVEDLHAVVGRLADDEGVIGKDLDAAPCRAGGPGRQVPEIHRLARDSKCPRTRSPMSGRPTRTRDRSPDRSSPRRRSRSRRRSLRAAETPSGRCRGTDRARPCRQCRRRRAADRAAGAAARPPSARTRTSSGGRWSRAGRCRGRRRSGSPEVDRERECRQRGRAPRRLAKRLPARRP